MVAVSGTTWHNLTCCEMTEKDYDSCVLMRCHVPAMSLLFGTRRLPDTTSLVFTNFSEGQSFTTWNTTGCFFSAVGSDQKLEQTINLSSKSSCCWYHLIIISMITAHLRAFARTHLQKGLDGLPALRGNIMLFVVVFVTRLFCHVW